MKEHSADRRKRPENEKPEAASQDGTAPDPAAPDPAGGEATPEPHPKSYLILDPPPPERR
jgi:hypothetical protein